MGLPGRLQKDEAIEGEVSTELTRGGACTARAIKVPAAREQRFLVITFQTGEHPEFKVEGKGLKAVVTVGKRTVRFDGTKVVLGSLKE